MKSVDIAERFLTKSELAAALKVSERTLDNWRKLGVLNTVKIGKVLRFDWDDVLAQMAKYRSGLPTLTALRREETGGR